MRKILLGVLAVSACFGFWAAGCRQDSRQSSKPAVGGSQRMTRAPGDAVGDDQALRPSSPALIDPEVLSAPDQPTFARIRAVLDREEAASVDNEIGLFVLPQSEPVRMAGAPALDRGDVIGSYPASRSAAGGRRGNEDYAAMAPPAARAPDAFEFAIHPSSIPGMYFGPDGVAPPVESLDSVPSLSLPGALTAEAFDNVAFENVYGELADLNAMPELSPSQANADAELVEMRVAPVPTLSANNMATEPNGTPEAAAQPAMYSASGMSIFPPAPLLPPPAMETGADIASPAHGESPADNAAPKRELTIRPDRPSSLVSSFGLKKNDGASPIAQPVAPIEKIAPPEQIAPAKAPAPAVRAAVPEPSLRPEHPGSLLPPPDPAVLEQMTLEPLDLLSPPTESKPSAPAAIAAKPAAADTLEVKPLVITGRPVFTPVYEPDVPPIRELATN